jgi:hypothetical protein
MMHPNHLPVAGAYSQQYKSANHRVKIADTQLPLASWQQEHEQSAERMFLQHVLKQI